MSEQDNPMQDGAVVTVDEDAEIDAEAESPELGDEDTAVTENAPDLTTPEGVAEAIEQAGDARLDNPEGFFAGIESFREHMASYVKSATTALKRRKQAARDAAFLRRYILLPGGPDWAGTTAAYSSTVEAVARAMFPEATFTRAERTREWGNIKGHVNRTFRDLAIRAYVWTVKIGDGEHAADWEALQSGDAKVAIVETPEFLEYVRQEYRRCDLAIPDYYLTPEQREAKRSGGGGPGNNPPNPAAAALEAIVGLEKLTPKYQAISVLRACSDLAKRLHTLSTAGIDDRPEVLAAVKRAQSCLHYSRRVLDSQSTAGEWQELETAEVLYSEADSVR